MTRPNRKTRLGRSKLIEVGEAAGVAEAEAEVEVEEEDSGAAEDVVEEEVSKSKTLNQGRLHGNVNETQPSAMRSASGFRTSTPRLGCGD